MSMIPCHNTSLLNIQVALCFAKSKTGLEMEITNLKLEMKPGRRTGEEEKKFRSDKDI